MSDLDVPAGADSRSSSDEAQPLSSADLKAAIIKQIEFYFSDSNLPTDNHLLKLMQKDPEGYVTVKSIATFKRVKALSKDIDFITNSLKSSEQLLVSEDGKKVRRKYPLPEVDVHEIQRRTVIVENFQDTPLQESVTAQFLAYGNVNVVRICSKNANHSKLPAWLANAGTLNWNNQQFALVEFANENAAVKAVHAFENPDNWRTSLRVRHLLRNFKPGAHIKSPSRHGSSTEGEAPRASTPTHLSRLAPGSNRSSLDITTGRPSSDGRRSFDSTSSRPGSHRPSFEASPADRKSHLHHHHQQQQQQQQHEAAEEAKAAARAVLAARALPSIKTGTTPTASAANTPKASDTAAAAAAAAATAAVSAVRMRTSDSGSRGNSRPGSPSAAAKRGGLAAGQPSRLSDTGNGAQPGSARSQQGAGQQPAAPNVSAFIDTILANPTNASRGSTPRKSACGASPFGEPACQDATTAPAASSPAAAAAAAAAAFAFSPSSALPPSFPHLDLPDSPVASPTSKARQQLQANAALLAMAKQALPLTPIPSMDVEAIVPAAMAMAMLPAAAGARRSSMLDAAAAALAGLGLQAEQQAQQQHTDEGVSSEEAVEGAAGAAEPHKRRRRRSRRKSTTAASDAQAHGQPPANGHAPAAQHNQHHKQPHPQQHKPDTHKQEGHHHQHGPDAHAHGHHDAPAHKPHAGGDGKGGKAGKKDYALWAAATPEFRKESAAIKYGTDGVKARAAEAGASPARMALARPAAPGSDHGGVRTPRGPDGSRGFAFGRGKAMAAPPLA